MRQTVKPIKDSQVLSEVLETLLHNFKFGRRNYTIFQVGKATCLRVSDVLRLKKKDVFDQDGNVRRDTVTIDKKTRKNNAPHLRPVEKDLIIYREWLKEFQDNHPDSEIYSQVFSNEWLFPSFTRKDKHIDERNYYQIMHKTGDLLGINYLGTHTMRKTGAYRIYEQSGHNIAACMKILNHSSEQMTLAYLGLDRETINDLLDKIDFGGI